MHYSSHRSNFEHVNALWLGYKVVELALSLKNVYVVSLLIQLDMIIVLFFKLIKKVAGKFKTKQKSNFKDN